MPYSNLSKLIRIQRAWRRVLRLKTNKNIFNAFISIDLNLNSSRGRSIQSLRTFLASKSVSEISRVMFVRLLTLCVFRHRIDSINKYPGQIDHHLVAYIIATHPGHHFLEFGSLENSLFHAAVRLVRAIDTLVDAFRASGMRIRRIPIVLTREYPEVLLNYMLCYREWSHGQSRSRAWQSALCYLSDLMSMDINSQSVRDDIAIVRRRIIANGTVDGDYMARIDAGYVPDDCWSLLHRLHYFTVGVVSKQELAHELCIDPMFMLSGSGFNHANDHHEIRFTRRRKMFWELVSTEMFQCPCRFDHLMRAVAEVRGGVCELGGDPSLLDPEAIAAHLEANEGRFTVHELQPISGPILTFLSRHLKNVHEGWDYVQCRLMERNDARIALPNLVSYCLKRLETIFVSRCNFKLRTLAASIIPLAPEYLRQYFSSSQQENVTREWVKYSWDTNRSSGSGPMTIVKLHAIGLSNLVFTVDDPIPETLVHDRWRIALLRDFFSSPSHNSSHPIRNQSDLRCLLEVVFMRTDGLAGCTTTDPWKTSLEVLNQIATVSILVHGQRYASMIEALNK